MTKLKRVNDAIKSLNENGIVHNIMYSNKNFDSSMNIRILTGTIKFIKRSERFDQPLLNNIKIILIFSTIPFLSFLLKKSFVLQLGFLL